ncbi:hypothetical protein PYCC9005_002012 [Savitreella phatthalungensis]
MSFLGDEIAKLKDARAKVKASSGSAAGNDRSKYLTRGQRFDERREAYLVQERAREEERHAREAQRRLEDEAYQRKRREAHEAFHASRKRPPSSLDTVTVSTQTTASDTPSETQCQKSQAPSSDPAPSTPPEEPFAAVISRLRALAQPIRLFGETDEKVRLRLASIEVGGENTSTTGPISKEPLLPIDPTSAHPLPPRDIVPLNPAWAHDPATVPALCDGLVRMIGCCVRVWWADAEGGDEVGVFDEVRRDLVGLERRLGRRGIPGDVLEELAKVFDALRENETAKAAQHHLAIAVGKHAWPTRGNVGVGIHERARPKHELRREEEQRRARQAAAAAAAAAAAKREKENVDDHDAKKDHRDDDDWQLLGNAGQAYMLADESTRLWLQAVRRLISHWERRAKKRST